MSGLRSLLLLCFFLSGATGLIYEVAWTRSLTLVFGTTTFAVSTILAAFMAGLGAGAWLFGRLVDRWGRPLRTYALLELGVGVFALAFPVVLPGLVPLYRAVWDQYHPSFLALSLLRFGMLFLLLLVPTMLMGGTLPALVKHFGSGTSGLGRRAGLLYGLNTLGAVLGAGAAGFALLPTLGLGMTTTLAAAFNLAIGAFLLALSRPEIAAPPTRGPATSRPEKLAAWQAGILSAFALSGFVALLSEVAWTRGLTLVLGSSTYAFTIMLVTFLAGLAGGSLIMARLLTRKPDLLWTFALLQIAIGVASLVGAHLFAELPLFYLYLFKAVSGVSPLWVAGQFALAGLIMLPPALLMGAVFPVVVQMLGGPASRNVGEQVGRAYAANTAGAVLGAFLGGFLLLPNIGIAGSLTLGIALSLVVALGLLVASGRHWRGASVTTALLLSVPLLAPRWEALAMSAGVYKEAPLYLSLYSSPRDVFSRLLPQFRLLYYREGPTATVAVTERPSLEDHRHLALSIDGKVDASTAGDMPTQVLSGHIPLLLHPRPEKVLVIGLASGVTVGAVTRHPVREITAVEIEPAVVEASRLFAPVNHRPLDDPRVRLVVDDARNVLLLSRDRYDVIISEPSNPWMSGPAKLFTREFFWLGRERLAPGGLFVQWLQLYGMTEPSLKALLRTFQSVFPYLLVFQPAAGDLLLVGGVEPLRVPVPGIQERMRVTAVAADLARVRVGDIFDLLTRFRFGDTEARAYAGEGPLNTDDNALIELSAPWEMHLETAARNAEALAGAGAGIARYLEAEWTSARERAEFLNGLAARALASRDWRQAEMIARDGLALAVSPEGLWVLGEALKREGHDAEAVRLWGEALAVEPRHGGALLSLALYYHERGGVREAEPYLESFSARSADNPVVNFLLGVNRYQLGLYRAAVAFLSRAEKVPAGGAGSAGWLTAYFWGDSLGVARLAQYYLHLAYSKLGNQRAAAEAWARFLGQLDGWRRELERRSPDPVSFSVIEHVRLRSERGVRVPEDAHLSEVLTRQVMEPLTRYYKGVTAYLLGYPEVASAELEAMLTLLGEAAARSRARYYLGLADWKLGRLSRARLHLEGFLDHLEGPERQSLPAAEASRALASIYSAQGQREQAAEHERRAAVILRAIESR
ncbi:MAG: fused MFS/spermidine synthase [Candidatus Rokubacteria bacterium]|nr:fused MFS/spermidine synthase [Candidatus Rokubacteria bacterium]